MIDCGLSEERDIGRGQRLVADPQPGHSDPVHIIGEARDIIVAEIGARRHGADIELALDLDRARKSVNDDKRHIIALNAARFLERVGDERRREAGRADAARLMAGDAILRE